MHYFQFTRILFLACLMMLLLHRVDSAGSQDNLDSTPYKRLSFDNSRSSQPTASTVRVTASHEDLSAEGATAIHRSRLRQLRKAAQHTKQRVAKAAKAGKKKVKNLVAGNQQQGASNFDEDDVVLRKKRGRRPRDPLSGGYYETKGSSEDDDDPDALKTMVFSLDRDSQIPRGVDSSDATQHPAGHTPPSSRSYSKLFPPSSDFPPPPTSSSSLPDYGSKSGHPARGSSSRAKVPSYDDDNLLDDDTTHLLHRQ